MAEMIKCDKCDRAFNEDELMVAPGKIHVHKGKAICEDCLVDMGITPDQAQPYIDYIKTRSDIGFGGV